MARKCPWAFSIPVLIDRYWHPRRSWPTTRHFSFGRINIVEEKNKTKKTKTLPKCEWVNWMDGALTWAGNADLGGKRNYRNAFSSISFLWHLLFTNGSEKQIWLSASLLSLWVLSLSSEVEVHLEYGSLLGRVGELHWVAELPLFSLSYHSECFFLLLSFAMVCMLTLAVVPLLRLRLSLSGWTEASTVVESIMAAGDEETKALCSLALLFPFLLQCLFEPGTRRNFRIFIQLAKDQGEACFRSNWPSWLGGISSFSSKKKRSPCTAWPPAKLPPTPPPPLPHTPLFSFRQFEVWRRNLTLIQCWRSTSISLCKHVGSGVLDSGGGLSSNGVCC